MLVKLTTAVYQNVFFSENGCNDQYEGATDTLCLRASAFPETYEDAQTRCNLEGGQLVQDYNPQIHVSINRRGFKSTKPFLA